MDEPRVKTVLIVDDEDDVLRFLSLALEDAGFGIQTARNSVEALQRLEERIPDLISLDIVMPGGGGVKLFRALKKKPQWSRIPVLVVTGHARDEMGKTDFDEMTMSGPGVYLEKPVTAEKYLAAVNQILGSGVTEDGDTAKDLREELKARVDAMDPAGLQDLLAVMRKHRTEK